MKRNYNVLYATILAITALLAFSCNSPSGNERDFNSTYSGDYLNRVAFPIGGMGAGMFCLEGNGCISHMSVRNKPDIFNEPFLFGAISIKGIENGTKVLEGPVQDWKIFGSRGTGNGAGPTSYGLPRFQNASFDARFPFGTVNLQDDDIPLDVSITGWSPFIPGDADNSSMPFGALEFTFKNTSGKNQELMFSYNSSNFMTARAGEEYNTGDNTILPLKGGYILSQDPSFKQISADIIKRSWFYHYNEDGVKINGLMGEYYNNTMLDGEPAFIKVDRNINMEWSDEKLLPGLNTNNVSMRWTGKIKPETSSTYMFAISGDDGYRLYINGESLISHWTDHGETLTVALKDLVAGQEYDVKLEFYQSQGAAAIRFGYQDGSEMDKDMATMGKFAIFTDEPDVVTDLCWFRGGWFDSRTMLWKDLENHNTPSRKSRTQAPGASLFVPFELKPGESKTVTVMFSWFVPYSNLNVGAGPEDNILKDPLECCPPGGSCDDNPACCSDNELCSRYYEPWYASKFKNIQEVASYWRLSYDDLRQKTGQFTSTFYDTDLPPVVMEAISANLTILKSPTVLRQRNGRLWGWEGCLDSGSGCCAGSCTHVWNYAQAICHLFPELERSLRQTEFEVDQNNMGHQTFRAALPIREVYHNFHAASDGQLGGIMKLYRDWRISGDTEWMKELFPLAKLSFEYCSQEWDPRRRGVLEEPHHNTYDIEFWGPDGMCSSFYLGATAAMIEMSRALGEDASKYEELLQKGKTYMETELFDGEYFIQKIMTEGLNITNPTKVQSYGQGYSEEALDLLKKEGPKYQYGNGCLSDGVLGCWIGAMANLDEFIDHDMVKSHLISVHKYNLKYDLSDHVNPQRPSFGAGTDGGTLLCTWPKGSELSLPFVYSNEVWTGIEYQVASHLMLMGEVEKGLDIVREVRKRYDGEIRNPFNEYECGHWYARAMSSYGMIQGLTGIFFDAVDKTLYIDSRIGNDFRSFFSCETGYGIVGLKSGTPFVEVVSGDIPVEKFVVSGKEL